MIVFAAGAIGDMAKGMIAGITRLFHLLQLAMYMDLIEAHIIKKVLFLAGFCWRQKVLCK